MKKIIGAASAVAIAILFILILQATINVAKNPMISHQNTYIPSIIDRKLSSMTLREKVAALFILHKSGYDDNSLKNYLDQYNPSGLIFMSDNIPPTELKLTSLTKSLQNNNNFPYLFAIDQEGGVVSRLDSDNYLSASQLKFLPESDTIQNFKLRSGLLKSVGMNLYFGIVADITSDNNSFIYPRVFGGNPNIVAGKIISAVIGSDSLVLSTLKHFPGHGEANGDSHFSLPITNISYQDWQNRDNIPFKAGILAGAEFVMFGHLIYFAVDNKPATLSKIWHDIILNDDKFNGIIITDDMIMLQQTGILEYSDPVRNAVDAIKAGNTMLLYVLDHGDGYSQIDPNLLINGIASAVENNEISTKTINDNVRKILNLRNKLSE